MNSKKEIYFSKDIYDKVAKKLGISPKIVEKCFLSYLKSFKENILVTDDIIYKLPILGEFIISKGDCSREINKLKQKVFRESDPVKKEDLQNKVQNYRVRLKKIKIELEKIKYNKSYPNKKARNRILTRRQGLLTPENIRRKTLLYGTTLEEAMEKQNKYAYDHYEKHNLPITL